MEPTIGRIVHFIPSTEDDESRTNNAEVLPAIITRVFTNGKVNLKVFVDGEKDLWRPSVDFSNENIPNSWHWPPRN